MTCKTNKLKYNCGKRLNARCTFYDGYIPEDSDLTNEDCVTIEETTQDLYEITDDIKSQINLSELEDDCIDYEEEESGNVKVNEAIIKHQQEICEIKELLSNIDPEAPVIDLEQIDTECLVDVCEDGFNSPEELLQAIITKLCELETTINTP